MIGLVAGSGLDAATVAHVAKQAGVSVGLVQHYFTSKDDLLLFAYQQVTADVGERVAGHITQGEARKGTISDVVFASMLELLPIDDRRRGECRVMRAFLGRSVDNATLAAVASATSQRIHRELATAVHNGKECGEVESDADVDMSALRIAALVDGLAGQLYQAPGRAVGVRALPDAAEAVLEACLNGIFTGECRQYR